MRAMLCPSIRWCLRSSNLKSALSVADNVKRLLVIEKELRANKEDSAKLERRLKLVPLASLCVVEANKGVVLGLSGSEANVWLEPCRQASCPCP